MPNSIATQTEFTKALREMNINFKKSLENNLGRKIEENKSFAIINDVLNKLNVIFEKTYTKFLSKDYCDMLKNIIKETKDFEVEKQRLINYIVKTQQLGENYFDNKESHSFGKLSKIEWNNMFYKHLNHHLTQFGAWL